MPTNAAEMAELKQEFDALRTRVDQLEAQRQGILDGLAEATGMSRRQILAIATTMGGAGALGAYGATNAQAAAQPSGGEGDVGSTTSPFEGFADGLAMVAESISSATTVTKPVVRYDCSISGFTITLGSELEGPSGFAQQVVLVDETGNAGSNAVTVDTESGNGIDGGASITVNTDNAVTRLIWDGGEWLSESAGGADFSSVASDIIPDADGTRDIGADATRWANVFTDTVDAGTVTTDDGTIGGDPILGGPSTSSDAGVSLGGGWTTLDGDQPVLLSLDVAPQTSGTNDGEITIEVDESGGTTADYEFFVRTPSVLGSNQFSHEIFTLYLPAGAQVRYVNTNNPAGGNVITEQRKFVISS